MKDALQNMQAEYLTMSKLYILAERLVDITTKNRVLDAMLSKSREKQDDRLCRYPNIDTVLII